MFLAEVVLDGLKSSEPVVIRIRDVNPPADRRDLGRGEPRDQLAQRGREHDHVGVDRDDQLRGRRPHGRVDALALAHVDLVAQHTNISELRGGFGGPYEWASKAAAEFGNVRVLRNQINMGKRKGINAAVRASTAELIVSVDSD